MLELSPAQLRVMASAVRSQVIFALARDGQKSVRDLAISLKRPASGLYHHIDLLERAGLVHVAAERPGPRRPEKMYELASKQLTSRSAVKTKAGRDALIKVGRRFMASAARSFKSALESGHAITEGRARNTAVQQIHIRLDSRALAQLNTEIDTLLRRAQKRSGQEGKGISVTISLSPTD